jgi:hypothetical protein
MGFLSSLIPNGSLLLQRGWIPLDLLLLEFWIDLPHQQVHSSTVVMKYIQAIREIVFSQKHILFLFGPNLKIPLVSKDVRDQCADVVSQIFKRLI